MSRTGTRTNHVGAPFVGDSFRHCNMHLSAECRAALCEELGIPTLEAISSKAACTLPWALSIVTNLEQQLFDVTHFVAIHCGADTSLNHTQSSPGFDPISLLMFPAISLREAEAFPCAPMPVKDVGMPEITSIGHRYQHALSLVERSFGPTEERHFRDHFFPRCQGEPVFELGYALDARAHMTTAIMECVTKQRLLLCIGKESDSWRYFNFSTLRVFGLHVTQLCGKGSTSVPPLGDLQHYLEGLRETVSRRLTQAEELLLQCVAARPSRYSAEWIAGAFASNVRDLSRIIGGTAFLRAQIFFLEELADSVPTTDELLRLLGANYAGGMAGQAVPRLSLTKSTVPPTILTPAAHLC